jgi:hypothetical protein
MTTVGGPTAYRREFCELAHNDILERPLLALVQQLAFDRARVADGALV